MIVLHFCAVTVIVVVVVVVVVIQRLKSGGSCRTHLASTTVVVKDEVYLSRLGDLWIVFFDVAFLPSRGSFSTTFLEDCGGDY